MHTTGKTEDLDNGSRTDAPAGARPLWRELLGLLLPTACAGCDRPGAPLCRDCAAALTARTPRPVRPTPAPRGLPPVHAAVPYADEPRRLLLAHKERGARSLAAPLGAALARVVRAGLEVPQDTPAPPQPPCVLLIPVPSSASSRAARGHDPTLRLAEGAAAVLRRAGLPARVLPALRHARPVADQAALRAAERHANLSGALALSPAAHHLLTAPSPRSPSTDPRSHLRLVLIDDLMTTGATLTEAARSLRRATCLPLAAAVVAAPRVAFEEEWELTGNLRFRW
ncbi:ComF family protein [Streptomyces polyrhachis]|uniref:ComF family protein n=1 Tax=Streptomyces polyrhachis TaxID=1282885 RepID=A0ABW2GG52_9ACTN